MILLNKSSFVLILLASYVVACSQPHVNSAAVAPSNVQQSSEVQNQNVQETSPLPVITPTPELEVAFGNGLRIVPKFVKLKNQRRWYEVDVTYPQVEGRRDARILNLNNRIRRLVTEQYSWVFENPSKSDIRYYNKFPGVLNTVHSTYEVTIATDNLLSIYFENYIYGIGAAHSVHHTFTVNYDVRSGKLLRLTDIFKPSVSYLHFVSRYCADDLTKRYGAVKMSYINASDVLAPKANNFQSWNITSEGLRFNFDACSVLSCAEGKQIVNIPFGALKSVLNPNSRVISVANAGA